MTPPLASLRDVPERTVFHAASAETCRKNGTESEAAIEGTKKDDGELAKINTKINT